MLKNRGHVVEILVTAATLWINALRSSGEQYCKFSRSRWLDIGREKEISPFNVNSTKRSSYIRMYTHICTHIILCMYINMYASALSIPAMVKLCMWHILLCKYVWGGSTMPSVWMSESAILLLCWFCDIIILTCIKAKWNHTVLLDDITGIKYV